MYENAHIQTVAADYSRRRDPEPSSLATFCTLKVCAYKMARYSDQSVSCNHSVLWQVACLNIWAVCRIKYKWYQQWILKKIGKIESFS